MCRSSALLTSSVARDVGIGRFWRFQSEKERNLNLFISILAAGKTCYGTSHLDVVAVRCGRCSRHRTCGANIEVDSVGVKRCSINFNQPETTVRQRLLSAVAMARPNLPVENMLCELCRSPSPKSLANRASIQFMCDLMLSLIHRDPRRRCQRCTPHTRPGVQNHVFVFFLDVCFLEQVGIISLKHI